MGDHQEREAALLDEIAQKLENLRLGRDVERRSRLVGDEEARLGEERHGDQDALAHAARQHDRIGSGDALGVRHAHLPEHLVDARHALRPVCARGRAADRRISGSSPIWSPMVKTGLSEVIGSWNTIDIAVPRSASRSRGRKREKIASVETGSRRTRSWPAASAECP